MYRLSYGFRLLVVAVSLAAWFVAGNHCALAVASAAEPTVGAQCPMHAQKQHMPRPKKGNGCGDLPCCKNLQATTAVTAKTIAKPVWLGTLAFFPQVVSIEIQPRKVSPLLDTGPPGENTFTESVLQRSIPAHAPPLFLS
jgi:hypothetical protein